MSDIFGIDENKNSNSELPSNENIDFDFPLNENNDDTQNSDENIVNDSESLSIEDIVSNPLDSSSSDDDQSSISDIQNQNNDELNYELEDNNSSNFNNENISDNSDNQNEEQNDYYTYQEKKSVDDILKTKKPKKSADKLKRQTILTILSISFLSLFLFTFFNINKKKDDSKTDEIQSASRAYVPDFEAMANNSYNSEVATEEIPQIDSESGLTQEELIASANKKIDANLNEVGTAPTRQAPNSNGQGGPRNVRPDTRNNYIQKQIQGIKGLTPTGKQQSENNFQQQQLPQSNNPYEKFNLPSKEDFVKQMMASQGLQGGFMNTQNQTQQAGKENFYSKNMGQMSNGEFLNSLTIWQGTIIPAVLITGINTDLPGNVIAKVTQNIYSSLNGNFLLIPQGTLLFAEYNSSVSYAQKRVQVAWNYMIRPDGFAVNLGNMTGVDNQGFSGYKGKVNNHPWAFVKGLLLVSAISIFDAELEQTPVQDLYTQKIAENLQSPYQKITNKIIDRALDIQPTIKIKPGISIKILTNTNLSLPPVEIPEVTQKYVRYR